MASRPPTCREAEDNLVRMLSELRSRDIVKTPHQDMVERAFKKCSSCQRNRNQCMGWHLCLRDATAIEFQHFPIRGYYVFARLQGVFSTTRSKPARRLDRWQSEPCSISSCAIEVFELGSRELVGRHHHDLANPRQNGPLWHLQMGGAPVNNQRLGVPRWPIAAMDPVLVIELAVYSFFNDAWGELRSTNPWKRIIKRSEELLLRHYYDRLHQYITRGTGIDSWLAHQCNIAGGWNPRPP